MSRDTELLPCPFCGSVDLAVYPDMSEDEPTRQYAFHVFCRDCHAHGRNNFPIGWAETECAAKEAWNRRVGSRDTELEALACECEAHGMTWVVDGHYLAREIRTILARPSPGTLHGELRELARKVIQGAYDYWGLSVSPDKLPGWKEQAGEVLKRLATHPAPGTWDDDPVFRKAYDLDTAPTEFSLPQFPAPAPAMREAIARELFRQVFPTVADSPTRWEQEREKLLERADRILALIDGGGPATRLCPVNHGAEHDMELVWYCETCGNREAT